MSPLRRDAVVDSVHSAVAKVSYASVKRIEVLQKVL